MRLTGLILASSLLLGPACGSERIDHGGGADGGAPLQDLTAGGTLVQTGPQAPPASAKVMVMWTVEQLLLDSHHKFGEGTATAAGYQLTLSTPPPAAALNNGNAGVGILYLVPASTTIADGPVDDSDIKDVALGAAGNYAIIYRTGNPTFPAWIGSFPEGYSCGIGVSSGTGGERRSFEPTRCDDLRIEVNELGGIQFVDWK